MTRVLVLVKMLSVAPSDRWGLMISSTLEAWATAQGQDLSDHAVVDRNRIGVGPVTDREVMIGGIGLGHHLDQVTGKRQWL